jgi:HTH-type transcriptional regulator/antitoxin HigA
MATKDMISGIPVPPGQLLAEILDDTGVTQAELARRMGRPPQFINELIHGKKLLTAATALQLAEQTDVAAYLWMGLESMYRLALEKQKQRIGLKRAS